MLPQVLHFIYLRLLARRSQSPDAAPPCLLPNRRCRSTPTSNRHRRLTSTYAARPPPQLALIDAPPPCLLPDRRRRPTPTDALVASAILHRRSTLVAFTDVASIGANHRRLHRHLRRPSSSCRLRRRYVPVVSTGDEPPLPSFSAPSPPDVAAPVSSSSRRPAAHLAAAPYPSPPVRRTALSCRLTAASVPSLLVHHAAPSRRPAVRLATWPRSRCCPHAARLRPAAPQSASPLPVASSS
ncbi:hypothetical protein GUJ93_ZPchr0006g42237 [Zizania palustris]|uniref:Uncharacterized protein n=1 Tax=Zizania palustris TaxID=103762 RepID=A0A8J5VKY3_ZIZPA|nr:hypothetical protein GUJ93_ZPchr0006g42237 [Zizania palustris]